MDVLSVGVLSLGVLSVEVLPVEVLSVEVILSVSDCRECPVKYGVVNALIYS